MGDERDVHTEHCCIVHGCKYGKEDCTVTTRQKTQSFACEWCSDDQPEWSPTSARIADLERALSDEKQCARLNAECHTREIRALQDMVEAEAEARLEAEGEVERLKADRDDWLGASCVCAWEKIAVDAIKEKDELEAELAGWKRVAVEAAIPLEALRMARPASDFSPAIRDGIEHAIGIIRRAVMGEGLPPALPPVPSSPKT